MRRDYIIWKPQRATKELIRQANEICYAYHAEGYDLTVRQLFYQFVARTWLLNNPKQYNRLVGHMKNARLAGMLDWAYIVDRTRNVQGNSHWANPAEIIEATSTDYEEDKWAKQNTYIEVWVEKDALVGILERVCTPNDVSYFSCRGYASVSEVWFAARGRIAKQIIAGKRVIILHLSDHDPSGVDMTRDLEDRLRAFIARDLFSAPLFPSEVKKQKEATKLYLALTEDVLEVRRIALTMDQVHQYDLYDLYNTAKESDSRYRQYRREFGEHSWELDALEPTVLGALIEDTINEYKDPAVWKKAVDAEKRQKKLLAKASTYWPEIVQFLKDKPQERPSA